MCYDVVLHLVAQLPFLLADKIKLLEKLYKMSTGGVPQGLRMVATVAATFLGGSFAIGFLSSSISERLTSFKKVKNAVCVCVCVFFKLFVLLL